MYLIMSRCINIWFWEEFGHKIFKIIISLQLLYPYISIKIYIVCWRDLVSNVSNISALALHGINPYKRHKIHLKGRCLPDETKPWPDQMVFCMLCVCYNKVSKCEVSIVWFYVLLFWRFWPGNIGAILAWSLIF